MGFQLKKIKWGIISTGHISGKFAETLNILPEAELVAVGSRNTATAKEFAAKYKIPNAYGSYEELANDPQIDVVYIGTPHSFHLENSALCMQKGKSVLCEKAFAINAREAKEMIRIAREKKVFLMEAMITRHIPVIQSVMEWIGQGMIGEVRMVQAARCARGEFTPEQRHLNPALGGGSLLDVGVYVISFSSMVYGKAPLKAVGYSHIGPIGSDEQGVAILEYENGAMSSLNFALRTEGVNEAYILGTKGRIKVHELFAVPVQATLSIKDKEEIIVEKEIEGSEFSYQVLEVHRCLRAGLLESPRMPLDESLQIMQTMDQIRAPWNLKYPNDEPV